MAISKFFNDQGGTLPSSSGTGSEITEDLTNQINGQKTSFSLSNKYVAGALRVYYNGLRQGIGDSVTEDTGRMSFTLDFIPLAGDKLFADYEKSTQ
ncbi:MAG: hypothetical protein CL605_00115 [Altibacter sp.]|uniref:hypothetical protein n=1 Tax=Altibacter sp. TaxID=2024823 RepID=UPI000C98D203|nr:hypothetical protein [Altibacter sp.]MAP53284.1 hypothetical protein [Altibacter sp.]